MLVKPLTELQPSQTHGLGAVKCNQGGDYGGASHMAVGCSGSGPRIEKRASAHPPAIAPKVALLKSFSATRWCCTNVGFLCERCTLAVQDLARLPPPNQLMG